MLEITVCESDHLFSFALVLCQCCSGLRFLRRCWGSAGAAQHGTTRRWSETPWLPSCPIRAGCSLAVSPPRASWMQWSTMCPIRHLPRAAEQGGTTATLLTFVTTQKGGSTPDRSQHTHQGRKKVLRTGKIALNRVWQYFSLTVRRIIYSAFSQAVEVYQHYRTARTKDSLPCPDAEKSYL